MHPDVQQPAKGAVLSPSAPVRPAFATLKVWEGLSGMTRSSTYVALSEGNLRAIKAGKRTLIDVEHGLAWMRSRPAATFRAPKKAA